MNNRDEKEYYQQGKGKGANVYIGKELIKVVDRFMEVGDFGTRSEASNELARLIKQYNYFLREQEEEQVEWGGRHFSMDQ